MTRPNIDDERFNTRFLSKQPDATLEAMRKELAIALTKTGAVGEGCTERRRRWRRQVRWLDARMRERRFFYDLRELSGVPQSKEERRNIFCRAFYTVALTSLSKEQLRDICGEAQALVDNGFAKRDKARTALSATEETPNG